MKKEHLQEFVNTKFIEGNITESLYLKLTTIINHLSEDNLDERIKNIKRKILRESEVMSAIDAWAEVELQKLNSITKKMKHSIFHTPTAEEMAELTQQYYDEKNKILKRSKELKQLAQSNNPSIIQKLKTFLRVHPKTKAGLIAAGVVGATGAGYLGYKKYQQRTKR
jgi:hypothetical protein